MSLRHISNVASLRAQVAVASASNIPFKISDMDQAAREAYLKHYADAIEAAASRYGTRSTFSTPATRVWTGVPTTRGIMAHETGWMIFRALFFKSVLAIFRWSLYAILAWIAIAYVPWKKLIRGFWKWFQATTLEICQLLRAGVRGSINLLCLSLRWLYHRYVHHHVIHAQHAIQERVENVDRQIVNFQHHSRLATAYLHYQQVINWFGRYKFLLIVSFVGIHLLSTMIESQKDKTEVFMEWTELQRYIEDPIPAYLFRQRKEYGSNSHYYREAHWWPDETDNNDMTEPGLMNSISVMPITTTVLEETAAASSEVRGKARAETMTAAQAAFCQHCRQEHCCEIFV